LSTPAARRLAPKTRPLPTSSVTLAPVAFSKAGAIVSRQN